ncbi:hypothetical protein cco7_05797, partial [Campylobacter coli 67-8]
YYRILNIKILFKSNFVLKFHSEHLIFIFFNKTISIIRTIKKKGNIMLKSPDRILCIKKKRGGDEHN